MVTRKQEHRHRGFGILRLATQARRAASIVISRSLQRPPKYLPVLLLFVTERCNLRCRMCGLEERRRLNTTAGELTTQEYKELLGSAARLGTSFVSISGGEALLRNDIADIVRYADEMGMAPHLCTNGLLLTEERIITLRDAGVAAISISMDSYEAALHDLLRGENNFRKTEEALRLLRRTAPHIQVGINYLITRQNFRHLDQMVDYAEGLGVHQLKFSPIHTNLLHREKPQESFQELLFREEDLPELEEALNRLKVRCKSTRLITTSAAFHDGIVPFFRNREHFRCYAGYAVCAIGPQGQVAPCCDMDSRFSVKDRPLHEIWRDSNFHKLRLQVHQCSVPCWDTTNTELSLRLHPPSALRNIRAFWKDFRFYTGRRALESDNTKEE